MSRKRMSGTRNQVLSVLMAAGLLTVPTVIALAEMDTSAGFSLFSSIGVTEIPRHSVQERARKKLIRVQQTTEKITAHEDTVSTEPPTTMIASLEASDDIDEIDVFPIVLAAPTH